ncbi:hypothetical protein [Streptococcus mitis]|nr:hypothetical protein [Streptococcus mitis]
MGLFSTSFFYYFMLNENQRATRKLATGCSKHCFEVADRTDEVSSKHAFDVVDEATLTWFEEIFEEY